jgi:hypothetical protein
MNKSLLLIAVAAALSNGMASLVSSNGVTAGSTNIMQQPVGPVMASVPYPILSLSPIKLAIPTNIIGYVSDPANLVASNVVYNVTGQVFTNDSAGHFKSITEGFGGDSTMNSPWNTLARLYVAYQNGAKSNDVSRLYSADSAPFLNSIYGDSQTTSNYVSFATGITNMSALIGYNVDTNGFFAVLKFQSIGTERPDTLPFYLVNSNGTYFVKSFDSNTARESNLGLVLGIKNIADILQ